MGCGCRVWGRAARAALRTPVRRPVVRCGCGPRAPAASRALATLTSPDRPTEPRGDAGGTAERRHTRRAGARRAVGVACVPRHPKTFPNCNQLQFDPEKGNTNCATLKASTNPRRLSSAASRECDQTKKGPDGGHAFCAATHGTRVRSQGAPRSTVESTAAPGRRPALDADARAVVKRRPAFETRSYASIESRRPAPHHARHALESLSTAARALL